MTNLVASYWTFLAWLVFGTAVYAIILNRLAAFAQPFRLKMAAMGNDLMASGRLNESDKRQIQFYLDHAFSVWPVVLYATLLPILFIPALIASLRDKRPEDVKEHMAELAGLFMISMLAANPLFGIVLVMQLFVVVLVVAIATAQHVAVREICARLLGPGIIRSSGAFHFAT